MSAIMEPTDEIKLLCDDTKRLIRAYLDAPFPQPIGRFESNVEAYTLLKLMTRHAEALVEIARNDLVLIPAAMVLARACFEASVRTRWMLRPEDPFEREVRWLLHLRTARDHCRKLEQNPHVPSNLQQEYGARGTSYEDFKAEVERLLSEDGYPTPARIPSAWDMVKDIGQPSLYVFYVLLSAYTHSNFEAGSLYRKNLGCGKELGEFIGPADWRLPFEVVWRSFFTTAREFLLRIEADVNRFDAAAGLSNFERHLGGLVSA